MRDARLNRAYTMLQRLEDLGMPLDWEDIAALAQGQSVGRPHVARALLNRGYVDSIQEAFDRYVARGKPAYVPRLRLTPAEVIEGIHAAGGVAVLAHPAHSGAVDLIPELVSLGIQGLEVYYPRHSRSDVRQLLVLCQRYDLIATGGSDFHAADHEEGAPLGSIFVPKECVEALQRAAGR
jgi:predicted metal-dependent phosphoesterase TrpH